MVWVGVKPYHRDEVKPAYTEKFVILTWHSSIGSNFHCGLEPTCYFNIFKLHHSHTCFPYGQLSGELCPPF